jgi:hypothetical protein
MPIKNTQERRHAGGKMPVVVGPRVKSVARSRAEVIGDFVDGLPKDLVAVLAGMSPKKVVQLTAQIADEIKLQVGDRSVDTVVAVGDKEVVATESRRASSKRPSALARGLFGNSRRDVDLSAEVSSGSSSSATSKENADDKRRGNKRERDADDGAQTVVRHVRRRSN